MRLPEPYFMTNKEWYYFDEENHILKLTDKATLKAKYSYREFYETINSFRDFSKDTEK